MASGDTLIIRDAASFIYPGSGSATPDIRNGHQVSDFDAAADESIDIEEVMPRHYGGGGVTITLYWMASTATSGTCRWESLFERHQEDAFDLDSDGFAASQSTGESPANVSGELQYTTIAHTDGGQIDSVAVGESFRLRFRRDADGTTGTDDMAGDAELLKVEVRET